MTAAVPIAFAGGLLAGSFATVVAHRLPRGDSFVGARAYDTTTGAEAWRRTFISFCCASPSIDYPAPVFVDE